MSLAKYYAKIYIQPWNWNGLFYTWKSSKHELSDDDGSTVVVDHSKNCLFQFVFNELNAHFLLLLVAIFQLVLSFWDCIYLLVTSGLVSVRYCCSLLSLELRETLMEGSEKCGSQRLFEETKSRWRLLFSDISNNKLQLVFKETPLTLVVPRGGLQHEAAFGQLQLFPQVVVFGSDFGDPLLTVLQELQLGAEACGPLKAETQPFSLSLFIQRFLKHSLN